MYGIAVMQQVAHVTVQLTITAATANSRRNKRKAGSARVASLPGPRLEQTQAARDSAADT